MPVDRQQMEDNEATGLSSFAQYTATSAGRRHPEPDHPYRTAYQRDRARIIHSKAFRRLEYKTQVFLNGTGDHLRTRLTHTIEVASVSRTIACALGANEDLAETIALAHDLGHSPFGHTGEEKLNELMADHGGFEHNVQSLRVVELLESVYPGFDGLNLSYEVLEGLRKHDSGYTRPPYGDNPEEQFSWPSIEAQIANIADEITYYSHDLDDGLDHSLIKEDQLTDIMLWKKCAEFVDSHYAGIDEKRRRAYIVRTLIDHQVADLVTATSARIEQSGVKHADEVRRLDDPLVGYSDTLRDANRQLRKFLYQNLYYHENVATPNAHGGKVIGEVFNLYANNPGLIGGQIATRFETQGLHRTVCDYISGMTDRYILKEHERLIASPHPE
ncbi:MAG: deoxyguanosinetriphosphate triphosphohydrolase [Verrucomicrobiaceae bacterium]|nr:deoxyguanosinetriphosphate triphosphohydrolase [Verrucomicrobiaceae bacterium]